MKSIIIAGFLFLGLISLVWSKETDPNAILQKSAEATSQVKSFKADMVIESFASLTPQKGVVYQKKQSDGEIAIRMEINHPTNSISYEKGDYKKTSNTYTLLTKKGYYTVIGNKAFKIPGMDKIQNSISPDSLKNVLKSKQLMEANCNITNGVFDGKECWIITIPSPPVSSEATKQTTSSALENELMKATKIKMTSIPLPANTKIYVEKQNNLIVKQASLDISNNVIEGISYQNIITNIEIPNDIFELPTDIRIDDMEAVLKNALNNINKK